MDKEIIEYFQENKDAKSQDEISRELREKGYKDEDIKKAITQVYICGNPLNRDFWNFKKEKTYCSSKERINDFLFGFVGVFLGLFLFLIPILGPIIYVGYFLYLIIYLFKRRKFLVFGILLGLIITIIAFVALLFIFWGDKDIYEALMWTFY